MLRAVSSDRLSGFGATLRAPGPPVTEAERAFYQQRLALFGRIIALLSLGFYLLLNLIRLAHPRFSISDIFTSSANYWHLAGAAVAGAVWIGARRRGRKLRVLALIDAAAMVAMVAAYSLTVVVRTPLVSSRADLILLLAFMLLHMARAVVVPSRPRHTALIALVSTPFPVLVGFYEGYSSPHPADVPAAWMTMAYDAVWCVAIAITATLASHVIYGLRREVTEARRLGPYTLELKLGEGGMGAVYRARHALLRRPTALKLLPPDKAGADNLLRFEREVQLTSRLTHPNTVAIYDYGRTAEGIFYYAMEYLDGMDLEQVVELDGAQPPARVAHVLLQVSGALAEAHAIGLVHRDIKPANIILCERGGSLDTAKLVDFGLVKQLDPTTRIDSLALSSSDVIMGTPLYLAPEAISNPDRVDGRSDIYALGAVAYYLLTGATVFDGRTVVEVCSHHLHSPPVPPSARVHTRVPAALEQAILSCLAKNPLDRPTAAELRARLLRGALEPWPEEDARAWWDRVGHRSAERRVRSGVQLSGAADASAATVDLSRRSAGVKPDAVSH